ncbi:MAG: hypothetical protein L3J75_07465 [Methylococcaceae bacterium]|nr:hypothetical protein [Methylococcaceae bacterium]
MDELTNLKPSTSIYGDESEYTRIAAIDLVKKNGGQVAIEFDNSARHIESYGSYDNDAGLYHVEHKDLPERIKQIELNHKSADLSREALKIGDDIKQLWEEKKNTTDPFIRKLIQIGIDELTICTYMP